MTQFEILYSVKITGLIVLDSAAKQAHIPIVDRATYDKIVGKTLTHNLQQYVIQATPLHIVCLKNVAAGKSLGDLSSTLASMYGLPYKPIMQRIAQTSTTCTLLLPEAAVKLALQQKTIGDVWCYAIVICLLFFTDFCGSIR